MRDETLLGLAEKLQRLRGKKKDHEKRIEVIQKKITDEMERRGAKGLIVGDLRITYVQQEPVTYYADNFKARLPGKLYKAIVKEVVDTKKLNELIESGDITMDIVAECSEVKKNKPFATIAPYEKEEE